MTQTCQSVRFPIFPAGSLQPPLVVRHEPGNPRQQPSHSGKQAHQSSVPRGRACPGIPAATPHVAASRGGGCSQLGRAGTGALLECEFQQNKWPEAGRRVCWREPAVCCSGLPSGRRAGFSRWSECKSKEAQAQRPLSFPSETDF